MTTRRFLCTSQPIEDDDPDEIMKVFYCVTDCKEDQQEYSKQSFLNSELLNSFVCWEDLTRISIRMIE